MSWETVIGLEVHVQLATSSKIFSGSSTEFGAEPNTQANAVDLGLPGVLPVVNEQAVRYALMFGLAIDAEIPERCIFDRKNYFYPDLPKGYQTTQMHHPVVGAGHVDINLDDGSRKTIRIHHAHLEEDAGKSLHEDFHGMTGIDLNRAGTPLIEVVTEPDMRNAEEAVAFARKLHAIVTSLGICDGNMSQGSMRFDVNISVRPSGSEELGTRTETKNLNSFRFMERAIAKEVERQIEVLEDGGKITQETRLYDGETDTARSMRSKEEAMDYRYFPCPDLLPIEIDPGLVKQLKSSLPELPDAKQARFVSDYQLTDYDADLLAGDSNTANYFEQAVATGGDAKLVANWVMGEISARLNSEELQIENAPLEPELLGQMIGKIKDGTISSKMAKSLFNDLWQGKASSIDQWIEEQGGGQLSDREAIAAMVDEVIANNPQQVENYLKASPDKQPKMLGFFVGQVMKLSRGKANPQQVNELLAEKLV
jgi:aspartyl-tRNA(Asn)/glutamyl-tRNA(Gln) amidotransferase subunit B